MSSLSHNDHEMRPEVVGRNLLLAVWGHKWVVLACVLAGVGAAGYGYAQVVPLYRSTAQVYIEPSGAAILGAQSIRGSLNAQAQILQSTPLLTRVLKDPSMRDVASVMGADNPIRYLKDRITIDVADSGDMIYISMESPRAADNAATVNAIVQAYINYHSDHKRSTANEVLRILRSEVADREASLDQATQKLLEFQTRTSSLTLNDGEMVMTRLNQLRVMLTDAEMDRKAVQTRLELLDQAGGDPQRVRQLVRVDPTYVGGATGTGAELTALRQQLALLTERMGPQHRQVQELRDQIAAIDPAGAAPGDAAGAAGLAEAYRGHLEALLATIVQRESAVRRAFDEQQARAEDLTDMMAHLQVLRGERQRILGYLDDLDDKIKQINVTEESGVMDIRILESAIAAVEPFNRHLSRTLTVAAALGLMVGLGLAFLLDWLDDRIKSLEEVAGVVTAPVLGSLPMISGKVGPAVKGRIACLQPVSHAAESIRGIRTMLNFCSPQVTGRTLVVTSAGPEEGKSIIAANLAISLADAGERVLLIDADCRAPMQDQVFGVSAAGGLTSVLQAQARPEEVIQATDREGLWLLPCGPATPTPSELLNSNRFRLLLDRLADQYDVVLIDTPPVLPIADGRIIAATCHSTLLVVRAGKTSRRSLAEAADCLNKVGANITGVVFNGIRRGMPGYHDQPYYPRTARGAAPAPIADDAALQQAGKAG